MVEGNSDACRKIKMAAFHSVPAMPGFTAFGSGAGIPMGSLLPAYNSLSSPRVGSILRGPDGYPGALKETKRFLPVTANLYAR
jgi:hypothetical protein